MRHSYRHSTLYRLTQLVLLPAALSAILLPAGCMFFRDSSPDIAATWPVYHDEIDARDDSNKLQDETSESGKNEDSRSRNNDIIDSEGRVLPGKFPLTLDRILSLALKNNPEIATVRAEAMKEEARVKEATTGHYPDLNISGGFRHHWNKERLVPSRGGDMTSASFSKNIFWADATLSIPIFSGGRVLKATTAARWMKKAAQDKVARTREELIFKIKTTFYAILATERLLETLDYSKKILEKHLFLTRELLNSQKAAPVDILKIEVRLANLQSSVQEQRGLLKIGNTTLISLMGIHTAPPETPLVKGSLKHEKPTLDSKKLMRQALKKRADLKELEHRMKAQANLIDGAKADYWPTVAAALTYGPRLSAEGDYDDLGYVGVNVSYSLLGWLRARPKISVAMAELEILAQKRRKLILEIRRDVETAAAHVQTALARIESVEASINKAKEVLRVEGEKASLGRGSTKDVLDAQDELLTAEMNHFQSVVALHSSLALLDLAVGKDISTIQSKR